MFINWRMQNLTKLWYIHISHEVPLSNKKDGTMCSTMNKLQKHYVEENMPNLKDYKLYDSI